MSRTAASERRLRWRAGALVATAAMLASVAGSPRPAPPAAAASQPPLLAADTAPIALSAPAAGSWGGGRLDVFSRSADGHVVHQWYLPGSLAAWSDTHSLGGTATSAPAVASPEAGRYDVFVRGGDTALWHRYYTSAGWSGWESLGGRLGSAPAAASWSVGRLDVFVRGLDGALWHRWYTAGEWSRWESLGGRLGSAPAAASWSVGRLDVFVRGLDGALWQRSYTSAGWGPWRSLGGKLAEGPGAAAPAAGEIDVFARGLDNALWTRRYVQVSGWGGWLSLGGRLSSAPSAAVPAAGAVSAFVRGLDGRYFYRTRPAGGAWGVWQIVDPALAFRRLGAWVDVFDYVPARTTSPLDPLTVTADLAARGVRTLYLQTARYDTAGNFDDEALAGRWMDAAHAHGIRVVGWYAPSFDDVNADIARGLAVAGYTSPAGGHFDALALDIEYKSTSVAVATWNSRVVQALSAIRAATARPVGSIVIAPLLMDIWSDATRWVGFPWPGIGANSAAVLPMNYWTGAARSHCQAGETAYCVSQFTTENISRTAALTGRPVHPIGGVMDLATLTEVNDYVRAVSASAAIGGGLYDYATTAARGDQAQVWQALAALNSK